MSMEVGGSKGGAMADINVTPMADIMIVLLIIFMVITPMLQKGVDVKLPAAGNTKERKDEPKTITVAIKKDGTTFLGGVKVDNQPDLVPQLKERLEDVPEGSKIVFLKADEELPYSEVMKVMDLACARRAWKRSRSSPSSGRRGARPMPEFRNPNPPSRPAPPSTRCPRPRSRPSTGAGSSTPTRPPARARRARCPTSTSRRSST